MRTAIGVSILAGLIAVDAAAQEARFATYNASLNRRDAGDLLDAIEARDAQIAQAAQIIRAADADVLLINEFDYDPAAAAAFVATFLDGMGYDHSFIAPSNTGVPSGFDLNGDGVVGATGLEAANDALGFGFFAGQYGMLVLSRHPLGEVRTFQEVRWADMPDARLPQNPDGTPFYSDAALEILRLSSKSHWDVPVEIDGAVVHFLVSHPTPPVFDGPEDRNGTRNFDEIGFWADYIEGADWMTDDAGARGGLADGAHFVIAGDLNSDPLDGDSIPGAAQQLLEHPLVDASVTPASPGGAAAAAVQLGANETHRSDPRHDTADFGDDPERFGPGNLRADYVLPSATLEIVAAEVLWPEPDDPLYAASLASDHRLVWVDVRLPE